MSTITQNTSLAPLTSLKVGGPAERLHTCQTTTEVLAALKDADGSHWMLGYGSNCLISDRGLPGDTILWRGGEIEWHDHEVVVDAGVWWDDLVQASVDRNLWGLELMSEIPSSVGGAVFGNIAAYGQQVSDALAWVEVYDTSTGSSGYIDASEISFSYRESSLQSRPEIIILRVAFRLSSSPLHELRYDAALQTAERLGLHHELLRDRREIIVATRERAGSIYHPNDPNASRTAGSFFKNPLVSQQQALDLASFDETGKTHERIMRQNQIHGGAAHRASAAHILLAAGFRRGQSWGTVRLHPDHVLKIETLPGANAQTVYNVSREITTAVKDRLDIDLVPEVRFLGNFSTASA